MNRRMPDSYFDEKKERSITYFQDAIELINDSLDLVKSMDYEGLNQVSGNSNNVHERINDSFLQLLLARREFEKALWASSTSSTEKTFEEDWLLEHKLSELVSIK